MGQSLHIPANPKLIGMFTGRLIGIPILPAAMRLLAYLTIVLALMSLPAPASGEDEGDLQQAIRRAVQLGKIVPLEQIVGDALQRIPGRIIEVEVDLDEDEYELEVLDSEGVVWELDYRASTGELIDMELD